MVANDLLLCEGQCVDSGFEVVLAHLLNLNADGIAEPGRLIDGKGYDPAGGVPIAIDIDAGSIQSPISRSGNPTFIQPFKQCGSGFGDNLLRQAIQYFHLYALSAPFVPYFSQDRYRALLANESTEA
jgi:hypothetical protein